MLWSDGSITQCQCHKQLLNFEMTILNLDLLHGYNILN